MRMTSIFAWLPLLCALAGCVRPEASGGPASWRQGYHLLYDLLARDAHADKVLWVKFESDEVDALMTEIVALCSDGKDRLDAFAASDPSFAADLERRVLPDVEKAARSEIESETASELLGASGREFELRLLITQLRALRYASSLCRVLADSEGDEARRSFLERYEERCTAMRKKVFDVIVVWLTPED